MSLEKNGLFSNVARPEPLHMEIASRILEKISSGELAPGDRLPSEHELAQVFSISRNVVREAIACLRADGLIQSRQGIGAVVLDPKHKQAIRINAVELEDRANLRHLFELRGLLEVAAAGLAASRRTVAQMDAITAALSKMDKGGQSTSLNVDADLEFHYRIAEATGNPYLVEFLNFVDQGIRRTICNAYASHRQDTIVGTTIAEHRRVHDAIVQGQPDAARDAMRAHIDGAAQRQNLALHA